MAKKEFWLTKDKSYFGDEYELWDREPKRLEREDGDVVFARALPRGPIVSFCSHQFEEATGIVLKEGEGFKIRLAIKVLRSKRIVSKTAKKRS